MAVLAGIGVFCWLLYSAAIYALPVFFGLTIFSIPTKPGAGTLGAVVLGLGTGALVLVIGKAMFTVVRLPFLRIVIGLIFAVPAALAGYFMMFGLCGLTAASEGWRAVFAIPAAMAVGATAWLRLAAMPSPADAGEQRRLARDDQGMARAAGRSDVHSEIERFARTSSVTGW